MDISGEIDDGDKISYSQTRSFEFIPELSCETCGEFDALTTLNAPLLVIVNVILHRVAPHEEASRLLRELNEAIENSGEYQDNIFINKVRLLLLPPPMSR